MEKRAETGPLWKISVAINPEAEEAVAELLGSVFGQPASSHTDFTSGRTAASVYCEKRPNALAAKLAALRDGLDFIKRCGLNIGDGRISSRRIRPENWAESWKRHFKPIEIGGSLLVKPGWSRRRPGKGQAVVVLDPGLSFGTGQHPTTSFCLRQLVAHRKLSRSQGFLDIGTGSGILAIAAAKLGYSPVDALDFDPQAVRIARANAAQNHVRGKIRLRQGDLTELPLRSRIKYDFVCANLISNLLLAERERILSRLQRGGVLVLAGILKGEFSRVQAVYESAGLKMITAKSEKEWRSGAFRADANFFRNFE